MKIVVDANVLIRVATQDNPAQAATAMQAMRDATSIALTVAALCEFVWVLNRFYRRSRSEIAQSVRTLLGDRRVACDREAIEAGLRSLSAGGDFADGVIAFDGDRINGGTFVTFDRRAARQLEATGMTVTLLP